MVHGITPEESSSDQGRTQSQPKFEVYVPMTQSIVGGTDGNKNKPNTNVHSCGTFKLSLLKPYKVIQ